jgi:hypothetical protein
MTINPVQYDWFDEPIQDVWFDDATTTAIGEAFDYACMSLDRIGNSVTVRNETIAKWFIEAAKNGERDFRRLYEQVQEAFGSAGFSMPVVRVGRDPPVTAYASVARAA